MSPRGSADAGVERAIDPRLAKHLAAEIECPFCGEGDFDLNGLKGHLQGGCEAFDAVISIHAMTPEEFAAGSEASREFRRAPARAADTGAGG